jgi:hypothetical protein
MSANVDASGVSGALVGLLTDLSSAAVSACLAFEEHLVRSAVQRHSILFF